MKSKSTANLAESFHQLWLKAPKPDLAEFLARAGPLPLHRLAEVIRVDQRQRWKTGEPAFAEAIFRQFSDLETDPDLAVDIIFNEFLLREKHGPKPELDEFVRRFPNQATELKDQIELHRALDTECLPNNNTDISYAPMDNTLVSVGAGYSAAATVLPEKFGRYRIIKPLGQGGMGSVYLAHDTQLDRQVALKVPRFDVGRARELVERFYREARTAATFHHPNLCPVYDVGEIDGTPFLTMPFLAGEPLSDYLKRNQALPQATACLLAMKVARAVHVAHQAGVRHRDLKPSNIMIQEEMQPVVMDFGLARRGNENSKLTKEGKMVGTCGYMPPEQIKNNNMESEPASDIYSLGVILYEMLTGRLPFQGPQHDVLHAVLTETPPSPRQFRPDLDPDLEAICMKSLAKNAADRCTSMAEFVSALEPFAGESSRKTTDTQVVPPSGLAETTCIKVRRRIFKGAAGVLAAASMGLLVWRVFP